MINDPKKVLISGGSSGRQKWLDRGVSYPGNLASIMSRTPKTPNKLKKNKFKSLGSAGVKSKMKFIKHQSVKIVMKNNLVARPVKEEDHEEEGME